MTTFPSSEYGLEITFTFLLVTYFETLLLRVIE